jgi:acyl-[acyl-carrier-protein]-phospholipid O-acyltransferase/long-chain-fatty-acid--[acyl-carrier-protein] ligase
MNVNLRPTSERLHEPTWRRTLFDVMIDHAAARGAAPALEDQERQPLSYSRLLIGALVLGRKLAATTEQGERVALFLPNVNAVAVTFLALHAYGRVPAMLNYTAGINDLLAAAASAEVKTVVTSRRFIGTAGLEDKIAALGEQLNVIYLEDVRESVGLVDRLRGLLQSRMASRHHARFRAKPDDIAVILFTSGTERQPKGVALTHANLLANIHQVRVRINCTDKDVLLNALPVFHAFGLTAGLLLPMVVGFRGVLYPSPLHYDQIPKLSRETGTTILIGIDTFAAGWARASAPGDFASLRLMVLGAEKVKDTTRKLWLDRCGIEILEGYGVTEAAPVLAVNVPGQNRIGSVGPLLAGIEMRLEPVEGIAEGAKLVVRGPNVMAGYIFPDRPGVLVPPNDGWHDTGDIVTIDDAGAVTIVGRAKRFAKIAGEMISLASIEMLLREKWPDSEHAVVAIPSQRKGEALVAISNSPEVTVDSMCAAARGAGISELLIPNKVIKLESLPLLGNGKTDYVSLERMAVAAASA